MVLKIVIVGGGIIGYSCAVRIKEFYGPFANVTVISDKFSPNTTGDGSAGLWGPYLCGGTPTKKIVAWSKDMHDFLKELWLSGDAGEAGVCLIHSYRVSTTHLETFWKDIVYGYRDLTTSELEKLGRDHNKVYTTGASFVTFTVEPLHLLPYLMKRFTTAGGCAVRGKVNNLYTFAKESDCDVVINCTGMGAKHIVPDLKMQPIRGQVIRVKANWIYSIFFEEGDDGNYIIPNVETVVLGGTHQVDDYNTNPCPNDREFILKGCRNLLPALTSCEEVKQWVGLRPGRYSVRLEKEVLDDGKIIIHNYGHGGCGVTLAWGCALDTLNMLKEEKSKL